LAEVYPGKVADAGERIALITGSSAMILNPDHVTIAVAKAGPAIDFFALLGFRKEHVAAIDGGAPARYMGMPGMKAQHITLVLEGADPRFEIQLLEFDPTPGSNPGAHPTNLRRRGFNHLAFRVDDIEAVTTHLVANGVTMLSDEMDYISRKLRLFEGPEGITLELVQRSGPDASS
jgi:catechol 2,3-dioxygenase-like lactoylglutathione lyase family enzyme